MVHILPRAPVDCVLFMLWCFTVAIAAVRLVAGIATGVEAVA
jgi:hypothetical protein